MKNPYEPPIQSDYSQGFRDGYKCGFDLAFKRYTTTDEWSLVSCYIAGVAASFIFSWFAREGMPAYDAGCFLASALILLLAIAAKNAPAWIAKTLSEKK